MRPKIFKALSILLLFAVAIFTTSCKEDKEIPKKEFKKEKYSEYLLCKADGVQFAAGNNSEITTAIFKLNAGGVFHIEASNGEFVPSTVAPQEIRLQLKAFSSTTAKNYDVSGTYPAQIDKLNGTNAHYITNDGTMAVQTNAIRITKIEAGYIYGTFAFRAWNETDKTKHIEITDGEFKVKLPS